MAWRLDWQRSEGQCATYNPSPGLKMCPQQAIAAAIVSRWSPWCDNTPGQVTGAV